MAKRPDIFNQQAFEDSLRQMGCTESFVKPITSDFRLFVPVILKKLGKDKIFEIVNDSRQELMLGEQEPAWREACKYIVLWAENEVEKFVSQK